MLKRLKNRKGQGDHSFQLSEKRPFISRILVFIHNILAFLFKNRMTNTSNKKSKLRCCVKWGKDTPTYKQFCLNHTDWKVFLIKAASVDVSRSSYHHVILPCKSCFLLVVVTFVLLALQSDIFKSTQAQLQFCSHQVQKQNPPPVYGKTTEHFKKCKPLPTNYYTKSNMLYSLKTA